MKLKNLKLFITSDQGFAVTNPVDDTLITYVTNHTESDVKAAIQNAHNAFNSFRRTLAEDRAAMLFKWADLMMDNQDDLAIIMTTEQGKPLPESKAEIKYAADFLRWFGEEARRTYGDVIPSAFDHTRMMAIKQPVGVCGIITPWNFPAAMITRKVGAAIAAGCTSVCKPASATPLSAMAMQVLATEAGVPDHVFTVLPSNDAKMFSQTLCDDERVKKISFTGSTAVGKVLMKQSADSLKKLSLELGGNAPFIVFDDADIEAAADGAIASKFRNAGQTCICANRFYVHENVYDDFNKAFFKRVQALQVGDGTDESTDIGPLINKNAIEQVNGFVKDALNKGGELQIGGKPHDAGQLFYEPTVITGCHAEMNLAREEIFGPVAPIFKFTNEDEVIQLANDTQYGLAGYFYGRDIGRIWRVAEALEYGIVGVNRGSVSSPVAPFGGVKHSGFGREGGKSGIDEYMNVKYVCIGL